MDYFSSEGDVERDQPFGFRAYEVGLELKSVVGKRTVSAFDFKVESLVIKLVWGWRGCEYYFGGGCAHDSSVDAVDSHV